METSKAFKRWLKLSFVVNPLWAVVEIYSSRNASHRHLPFRMHIKWNRLSVALSVMNEIWCNVICFSIFSQFEGKKKKNTQRYALYNARRSRGFFNFISWMNQINQSIYIQIDWLSNSEKKWWTHTFFFTWNLFIDNTNEYITMAVVFFLCIYKCNIFFFSFKSCVVHINIADIFLWHWAKGAECSFVLFGILFKMEIYGKYYA